MYFYVLLVLLEYDYIAAVCIFILLLYFEAPVYSVTPWS